MAAAQAHAAPCDAPACVDSIEVDGQKSTQAAGVVLQPRGEPERKATLAAGARLAEGTLIETPTRPRVRLQLVTRNGNTVTLEPGARLRLEAVGEHGERFAQLLGEARFAVVRALGFFEVTHDRFLAAVKGTEFAVAIDEGQTEIRFDWFKGQVAVEREVTLSIADQDDEDPADADDDSRSLIEREVLSESRRQLRYRLGPREYLREFRTLHDAEQYFRARADEDEKSGDPERTMIGLMQLGQILNQIGKPRAALPVLERALALAASHKQPRMESMLARRMGFTHRELREFAKATTLLQRSLAIEERLAGGAPSIGLARAYTALGRTAGHAGDPRAWVAHTERAMQIQRRLDPAEDGAAAHAFHKNLADAYWAAGEREKAMRFYQSSLALKQKARPDGVSVPLGNAWLDLGLRHLQLGRTDAAIAALQKSADVRTQLFDGVHPSVAVSQEMLGRAYERAGDAAQAVARQRKALELRLQLYPNGVHPSIARSYRTLARLARQGGDAAQAAEYEARAKVSRGKVE
jgi:tetratricopeptide (TPR) repeat protein